jgi:acyl-coenzyme A thioesterase PaaI-like protein
MSDPVQLPDRHATLRLVPMVKDTNAAGDVFGGWVMSQVDIAGSIAAVRRAKGRWSPWRSMPSISSRRCSERPGQFLCPGRESGTT